MSNTSDHQQSRGGDLCLDADKDGNVHATEGDCAATGAKGSGCLATAAKEGRAGQPKDGDCPAMGSDCPVTIAEGSGCPATAAKEGDCPTMGAD